MQCNGCHDEGSCMIPIMYGKAAMDNCPCKDCVVKPMCSKVCDKWEEYTDILHDMRKERM